MDMSCFVCFEGVSRAYAGQHWLISGIDYRLYKCGSCGCAFTVPQPGDEVLSSLYRYSFDYRWYRDHYATKLRDCRDRLKEYGPLLGGRVLDFGGGLGYFAAAARELGLESLAFDPYVSGQAPQPKRWDSAVALHVLEHSNDLDRTLGEIKNLLLPGGRLVLAVPNFESLGYQSEGMKWVWAQPPLVHVFHFTAIGLRALLARHDFVDVKVSYHERWDANLYCDVEHAETYRKWDAAWAKRPFNKTPLYRRLIARINSQRRYAGLEKALKDYDPHNSRYAELQITGVLQSK